MLVAAALTGNHEAQLLQCADNLCTGSDGEFGLAPERGMWTTKGAPLTERRNSSKQSSVASRRLPSASSTVSPCVVVPVSGLNAT